MGGSGVGRDLLEKVIAAFPMAKETVPELRMIAVAGPNIDPESLPRPDGVEVHAYVDRLYRNLSVCDLAVVQGGLTTTMELTAAKRPFLYFPLRNHFEQNYHVRHRLDQYGAGRYMDYAATDADALAEAIAAEIGNDGPLPRRRDRRRPAGGGDDRRADLGTEEGDLIPQTTEHVSSLSVDRPTNTSKHESTGGRIRDNRQPRGTGSTPKGCSVPSTR